MSILQKYLNKLGVKSFTELNDEEKSTYKAWEESLSGRKLTDDEVATFFATELEETVQKLIGEPTGTRTDTFLKMKLDFIRKAQRFLDTPKLEKKVVEQSIHNLL